MYSFTILEQTLLYMESVHPRKHGIVDTGRKLNVHKTSIRRLGRLANILCTFNLRPVSTGMADIISRFIY